MSIEILEDAYGKPVDEVFGYLDREPLAAASIAQVHKAELPDGSEVVVKVLRPGVQEKIERDLEVMRAIARLADRYWEHGKRLKPPRWTCVVKSIPISCRLRRPNPIFPRRRP